MCSLNKKTLLSSEPIINIQIKIFNKTMNTTRKTQIVTFKA